MGRPRKVVDPETALKQRREKVAERFFAETKIALNEEHKRQFANFVLKEREEERMITLNEIESGINLIKKQFGLVP